MHDERLRRRFERELHTCARQILVGGPANLASAITANGNARLNLQGCSIGTNSSANGGGSSDAIYFGPKGSAAINLIESNNILGGRVSAVGGVSIVGNGSNTSAESCTSVSGSHLQQRSYGHPGHRSGPRRIPMRA